jgi:hypothetical protein
MAKASKASKALVIVIHDLPKPHIFLQMLLACGSGRFTTVHLDTLELGGLHAIQY